MKDDQKITWTNDNIVLISFDAQESRFYAMRACDVGNDVGETSYYFCRDGQLRTSAAGKTYLGSDLDAIFRDPQSAHYKTIDDFFDCHMEFEYIKTHQEWLLLGAL